ncbi:hypothetical protein DL98DRAFT_648147 [Cadophora sp. DSE1049]|nr:hypothetical protein DL98DRAFT_648147 [Cadophora sp. DSE1049]
MSAAGHHMVRAISTSEERSLAERDLVSWGGYGLQNSPCIEGTSSCGDSCCPNGYECSSPGDHKDNFSPTEAICCPTDADCTATVKVVEACANSSWGLYHAFGKFCCPSDFVGVYPEGGTGLMCLSSSLPIPSDKLALSVEQATSTKTTVATASSGSKTTSAGSGTITSGPDSESPADTTETSPSSGGLSKSATIAIAVLAAALGLLSILVIGYFLWRKKRRSTRRIQSFSQPTNTEPANAFSPASAPEKNAAVRPVAAKTAEFQVNELLGKNVLHPTGTTELETSHRAELYDTGRVQ